MLKEQLIFTWFSYIYTDKHKKLSKSRGQILAMPNSQTVHMPGLGIRSCRSKSVVSKSLLSLFLKERLEQLIMQIALFTFFNTRASRSLWKSDMLFLSKSKRFAQKNKKQFPNPAKFLMTKISWQVANQTTPAAFSLGPYMLCLSSVRYWINLVHKCGSCALCLIFHLINYILPLKFNIHDCPI